jgi:hypothetical protein
MNWRLTLGISAGFVLASLGVLAQVQAPPLTSVIIGTACTGGNSIWPGRGSAVLQCNGSTYQPSNPHVTPEMYGAVCDGATDDQVALQAWMNSGRALLLTSRCAFASPITVNLAAATFGVARGLSITGTSVNQAQLVANSTTATVSINTGAYANPIGPGAQIVMRDFAVVANVPNVGDITSNFAVQVRGSAQTGSGVPNFLFDNVMITGTSTSNYFNGGLYLRDVRDGVVTHCTIYGRQADPPNGVGIKFTTSAGGSQPVDLHIRDCPNVSWWDKCLQMGENPGVGATDVQGIYVFSSTFLACQNGIYWYGNNNSDALLTSFGNHFNHGDNGIFLHNIQAPSILQNNFLFFTRMGQTTTHGFYTEMVNGVASYAQINHNFSDMLSGAGGAATRIGITSHSSTATPTNDIISGNQVLGATTSYVGSGTGVGAGTRFYGNQP